MNDESESAYRKELAAAKSADLRRVQSKRIVQVLRLSDETLLVDKDGNVLVMIIPALVPRERDLWEESFQLFLRETEEIAAHRYRIIYLHSAFSPPWWFAWWLFRLRARVSRAHRKNLAAVSVLHPTFGVRLLLLTATAWIGEKFWKKLHYADRVEELWLDDVMTERMTRRFIPESVMTFERGLVEHAEMMRETAVILGVPLLPRERPHNAMEDGTNVPSTAASGMNQTEDELIEEPRAAEFVRMQEENGECLECGTLSSMVDEKSNER